MTSKRRDLQGIRGLAIISVLLFHFFPTLFPNGYIGVDQFFVLSGFLIAMILDREKDMGISTMTSFYYRRVKRIVPLYLIVVLCIILSLFFIFPSSNLQLNIASAWPSLFFVKNFLQGNDLELNYAQMLSLAEDVFTHTWSLGVEMQFYLIVPVLMMSTKYSSKSFGILFLGVSAFLSLAYFVLSDESTSFHSVFARIWQFIIGMLSHLSAQRSISKDNSTDLLISSGQHDDHKPKDHKLKDVHPDTRIRGYIVQLSTLVLIVLMFCPFTIDAFKLRLYVSLVTGLIIFYGECLPTSLLTKAFLVYTGDISYALYLVHWPIYAFTKLTCQNNMLTGLIIGILISIIAAIFLTEHVEKYYRRMGKQQIIGIILGLYCLNSILLFNQEHIDRVLSNSSSISSTISEVSTIDDGVFNRANYSIDEIIKINEQYRLDDQKNLMQPACDYLGQKGPYKWCNFKMDNSSSQEFSILLIGNSYAPNNAEPVYQYCSPRAKSMRMYSMGCEVLTLIKLPGMDCKTNYEYFLSSTQAEKPDVLFIFIRYIDVMFHPIENNGAVLSDTIYKEARERLKLYEAAVGKKIFILQALPIPSKQLTQNLNSALKKGERIENSRLEEKADVGAARKRIEALVKDCPKCELIDYVDIFKKGDQFQFYNNATGESYFNSGQHLTKLGVQKTAHLYEKICEDL